MPQDNGGPAFPLPPQQEGQDSPHGMTLLDYFAAQALPAGLDYALRQPKEEYQSSGHNSRPDWAVDIAYTTAVAMLAFKRDLET